MLVCQPSRPGSNPGGLVQSQLELAETHLAAAYIDNLVLEHAYAKLKTSWVFRATLEFDYRLGLGWCWVGVGLVLS